ncbi:MAG TPA: hypothetical protein VH107_07625, partial [Lacipirellulaceae bacterium]|nr:hypothetical protein [Lacipirellulaceae bacterium]
MANSTLASRPAKPRGDFPLFPHASGRWAKKVRGKLAYFGRWDQDPKGTEALKLWADQKDELAAGLTQRQIRDKRAAADPNIEPAGVTVADVVNEFLTAKEELVLAGKREQRTLDDYLTVGTRMSAVFGRNTLVDTLT